MERKSNFTIGFIGLGLIGGSIAKNIRRVYPNYTIIGYDTNIETLEKAATEGTIDICAFAVDQTFAACDYVFLCAPVSFNIGYLAVLKDILKKDCILTDVGSVKGPIHRAVKELDMESSFIGGHPMVGSEKAGFSFGSDRLIENAYYFITPTDFIPDEKVREFSQFIEELGALTIIIRPEKHDSITASISHVPHIIAAELVHLVRKMDDEKGMLKQLAAGGFKDITRIASSSPTVWEQISMENASNICHLLKQTISDLSSMVEALEEKNNGYINEYFKDASDYRDSVPDVATGLLQKSYELFIDIPDETGTIAGATTYLALNNINIKNLGIIHNREFEEGVFKLVFYDEASARKAYKVLKERNYNIHIPH